ncbi:MFS transporter [Nonomuraea sp. TT08I-71]|nr:MFS transporter [Nonomuraea sp. TT08I-71]
MSVNTSATPPTAHPRRWQSLGLLGLAQFILILDVTVVAIALPHMGADLDLGRDALTWVVSAYTLTFGGLMLLGGRSADLFGPKPLVVAGLVVFTAASLVTGLATGAAMAIGGRIAQGIGAAMLSPAALSVVVRLFDGEERNRALGIWSALGAGGAAIGVLLGGLLTSGPGWPWVFLVNVPVGIVVVIALQRLLPPLPAWGATGRLDLFGALLVTATTGLLILGFIEAGDRGWESGRTAVLVGAGIVGSVVLAGWLRRTRHPLIDPALVSRRPVLAGTFVLFIATALMVAVFFVGTFYLQGVAGHGPLTTGALFLPVAVATMAGAQIAGRLVGRLGARFLGVVGLLVAAAGLIVPAASLGTLTTVVAVSAGAAGLGALFVVASVTALSQVEPHLAGVASGILSTFHELGASLGAAVMSGVAAASLVAGTSEGFERAYLVAAVIAVIAAVITAGLVPGRPPASPSPTTPASESADTHEEVSS